MSILKVDTIKTSDGSGNLTVPNATGTLLTTTGDGSQLTGISGYADSDALSLFNASGSAPVYACRAWVNFNGTGTVAIRDSGNVSSITDNGGGNYTINFTTAMSDANYSAVCGGTNANGSNNSLSSFTTTSVTMNNNGYSTAGNYDSSDATLTVHQ